MLMWKTIGLLWPFLKELFLGKKTLREALKTNKGRVFLIVVIIGSVLMNLWLIPNIVRISTDYVELKHRYELLKTEGTPNVQPRSPVATPVTPILPVVTKPPVTVPDAPVPAASQWSSYDTTLTRFSQMIAREQTTNKDR